jgi:hypothetical protein
MFNINKKSFNKKNWKESKLYFESFTQLQLSIKKVISWKLNKPVTTKIKEIPNKLKDALIPENKKNFSADSNWRKKPEPKTISNKMKVCNSIKSTNIRKSQLKHNIIVVNIKEISKKISSFI